MNHNKEKLNVELESVKLKEMFGLTPPVYLSILYLLILLILLFLIAFLPGILKSGKRVTFTSNVEPVAVYLNDNYIGSNGVTSYVAAGKHKATFKFFDEIIDEVEFEVKRSIFLTLLFPRKQNVVSTDGISDITTFRNYINRMLKLAIQWSKVESDETYHTMDVFNMVAKTALNLKSIDSQNETFLFYKDALLFVESNQFLNEMRVSLDLLKEGNYFTEEQNRTLNNLMTKVETSFTTKNKNYPNLSFQANNLNNLIEGYYYTNYDFSIATSYISEYMWALFIDKNPKWAKTNIDNLIKEGLVDDSYLGGVYPTTAIVSNRPIKNISYYAAVAFTDYLSKETNKNVFLPTNEMWEIVASSVADKPYVKQATFNPTGSYPYSLLGGYWEFTSSSYIPNQELLEYELSSNIALDDVIVKGGSYLNDPNNIKIETIGVLSKSECSESASFRIAWKD